MVELDIEPRCRYCHDELDDEERQYPQRDEAGSVMCDRCYRQHYMGDCVRCDDSVRKEQLASKPGSLIVIWEAAPAAGQDDLAPGYYRVKSWPFFMDGMIEGFFFGRALKRVGDLDDVGRRCGERSGGLSGPMCSCCQRDVRKHIRARSDRRGNE